MVGTWAIYIIFLFLRTPQELKLLLASGTWIDVTERLSGHELIPEVTTAAAVVIAGSIVLLGGRERNDRFLPLSTVYIIRLSMYE